MMDTFGSLQNASVGLNPLKRYHAMWTLLKESTSVKLNNRCSAKKMDNALTNCLHVLFLQGESLSTAQYLVAAAWFFCPHLRSPRQQMLPATKQCLQGWRCLDPSLSRLPFPHEVVCLMADFAVKKGKKQQALMMHLAMEAYLRPGELNKIRVGDLVPPVTGSKRPQWSLVLHPLEEGQMSKAAEFDETVIFDLEEQPALMEAIYRVTQCAARKKQEPLFSVQFTDANRLMEQAVKHFSVTSLGPPHAYLQTSACGSFKGLSTEVPSNVRHPTERKMESRQKGAACSRCYTSSRLPQETQLWPQAAVELQCSATCFESCAPQPWASSPLKFFWLWKLVQERGALHQLECFDVGHQPWLRVRPSVLS